MANTLSQTLIITYSNQRVRDLKAHGGLGAFDRVMTLDQLIGEYYDKHNFKMRIDASLGSAIMHKIIQEEGVAHFAYLGSDTGSLGTIFDFIVKCHRNGVGFEQFIESERLAAIGQIDTAYQAYKAKHNLADIADVEQWVIEAWEELGFDGYNEVLVEEFMVGEIDFAQSELQAQMLKKLRHFPKPKNQTVHTPKAKIIRPEQPVFDAIDEVKTALKITRKLLEEGKSAEEILIVASDITEYAPLYKLFLDEYGLQGYSSVGTPLSAFHNMHHPKVQQAFEQYRLQVEHTGALYQRLGLTLSDAGKEKIKENITILDEKIGLELTEPNQLVGLQRSYEHIVFIGTDINHFPPQANNNFLYSYGDDVQYFHANNYFLSSQTQLEELKRLAENLYIVTASYSDKRELKPSILLDGKFDDTIDLSGVKSLSELALERITALPDDATKAYYQSIASQEFTPYDGEGVEGIRATHLSASQINKYNVCPLAYLYANKIKVQAPRQSDEGFDVMEQGSLMHKCYEFFGRQIKESGNTSTDKRELYDLMYHVSIEAYNHTEIVENRGEENIHHQIFLSTLQAGLKDERDAGLLAKFVDYYIEHAEQFEYFQKSEFEKEFLLDDQLNSYERKDENDYGYFIRGFIDRFDNLGNQINVIDYKSKKIGSKSGKHKKTQEKIDALEDVQLALYILYAKQQYPDKEYYASLLSFKGESKAAHFGEVLHEHFDDTYEEKLKEIIFDTKANIEKGHFAFDNSDEEACGWCDFRFICHESVLNKGMQ